MNKYNMPTRAQVQNLKVGDMAIDCFGKLARVTKITAQKDDIHGKAFVCYYTSTGENSAWFMSIKEDELTRTVHLSNLHTSAELDRIEKDMQEFRKTFSGINHG